MKKKTELDGKLVKKRSEVGDEVTGTSRLTSRKNNIKKKNMRI